MASLRRPLIIVALALLLATLLSIDPAQLPVRAATNDTPTLIVAENSPPVSDWIAEEGLLYWAQRCPGGEFIGPGFLRRMPIGGGFQLTLSSTTDDNCATFAAMTAEPEGLYYYSFEDSAIEFRPSAAPLDPPTILYPTTDSPVLSSHIVADADYLYWISYGLVSGTDIHRIQKDGTGYVHLYHGTDSPSRLIMLYGMLVWADSTGIWYLTPCDTPLCTRNSLGSAPGNYLDSYSTGLFTFELAWTDIAATPDRILRASCNFLFSIAPDPPGLSCGSATPFYSAPDGTWNIGQVRRAGSNLFWTERLAGSGPTDGRIRRKPVAGGDVQDILTNARLLDDELAVDNLYVYFATLADDPIGYSGGIFRLALDASAIVRDLRADWFEVTQGIQNQGNSVPLTADKPTYVRGYGLQSSGPNTPMVGAVLHGSRGGNPLPGSPLLPSNGTRSLSTGATYDRGVLNRSWLFVLPPSWTSTGTTDLRLEVDPIHAYPDPNLGNNSASQSLTFAARAPVCSVYVPVRTNAPTPHTSDPNFFASIDLATRMWPTSAYWSYRQDDDVAELEACWWGPFPYPCYGPYELPDDTWKVLLSLKTRDAFTDDPDECDDAGATTHYVGMVHPSTDTHSGSGTVLGAGYIGNSAAWTKLAPHSPTSSNDFTFPEAGTTLAHELAHNADRDHVNCGGADDPDLGYPYPTDQIANVGQTSYYGFDVRTNTVIAPDGAADLMGYCSPKWTSDYTWRALFNSLNPGLATAANNSLTAASDAVYASGSVAATDNSGTLSYAFVYPTAAMNSAMLAKWSDLMAQVSASAATYSLRVKDAEGNTIATAPVELLVASELPADSNQPFVTVFAAPAAPAAKLELLKDSTVLTTLQMGPDVPTVTVNQPVAGATVDTELNVQWQATDPNGSDILLYTIQYSPDNGATWSSLASDYADQPGALHTFTLLSPAIPATAGPNQGRIRILASDGYNTALGESQGFTVVNRKPEAHILTPVPGASVAAGAAATLRGEGFDLEDGPLTGNALSWQLLGLPVGTGAEVSSNGLAPGIYPVKLTATDSLSATGVATGELVIRTLGIPAVGIPTLDGYCTDAVYETAVELPLRPYGAGDQAVVRLLRSSDDLWACFSGLKAGALTPGAWAGLMIDPNFSRGLLAQADDYAFVVGENGAVATLHGNNAGFFALPGPGGLQAQVAKLEERWSAELRIDKDTLGGWDRVVGLAAAHLFVANTNDSYLWPYLAFAGVPDLWAPTALGDLPILESLSPATVAMQSGDFTLTINGQNFTDQAVVLYNGEALPTTFVNAQQLQAPIAAAKLLLPGEATIRVRAAIASVLTSNALSLTISTHAPTLSTLSPGQTRAGEATFVLTVTGEGFGAGDTTYWQQTPLATTFVNATQLQATVPDALFIEGGSAGITVYRPGPDGGAMSNTLSVTIQPGVVPPGLHTVLPFVKK